MIQTSEMGFISTRRAPARIHAVPAQKSSITRFVEAIDAPVALASGDGRLISMNAAARDFFIGRDGQELRESVESMAREALDEPTTRGAPNRTYAIESSRHRVTITLVTAGQDLMGHDVGALVLLRREPIGPQCPPVSEHALATRFGLTGQEARVAVMLADQRTNREIAARLGVSVHTARHHTERVLAKLHIHSRYDVRRVIS
jgi:DNA-binding CsgD family transcriptional regulator